MLFDGARPEPGIYDDVPFEEYLQWGYPSQSILSMFRNPDLCELDILYRLLNPPEQTAEMELGHLLEQAVDSPDDIIPGVKPLPPAIRQRRGEAWEELQENHPGVIFLPPSEWAKHIEKLDMLKAMARQVELVAGNLLKDTRRQVSFVWDAEFVGEGGEQVTHRVKGRADYVNDARRIILDLKSTSAGGPRAVGRVFYNYAYDIQSALYTDALSALVGVEFGFYFVVCRTSPPYPVTVYDGHNTTQAAGQFLDMGRRSYQVYLERLANCLATDNWRGYYNQYEPTDPIMEIELPSWAE